MIGHSLDQSFCQICAVSILQGKSNAHCTLQAVSPHNNSKSSLLVSLKDLKDLFISPYLSCKPQTDYVLDNSNEGSSAAMTQLDPAAARSTSRIICVLQPSNHILRQSRPMRSLLRTGCVPFRLRKHVEQADAPSDSLASAPTWRTIPIPHIPTCKSRPRLQLSSPLLFMARRSFCSCPITDARTGLDHRAHWTPKGLPI